MQGHSWIILQVEVVSCEVALLHNVSVCFPVNEDCN